MRVLMIGGDRSLGSGHPRYELQRSAVEQLDVFVWPQTHSWLQILRAARRGKYDVITVQDPFWRGLLGWVVARASGAKLNVQVHTDLSAYSGFRGALSRFVLRHADSIRVVSESIQVQVEKIGVSAKITILPVYVDINRFRAIKREPHDKKNILWIGRFEKEKDPEVAVDIWKSIRATGIDVGLIMLGEGSLGWQLKSAYNLHGPDFPVEFPGWVDPLAYIAKADVVLCTSRHESWGQSIVEALAAGVPVVAPDVGVAREAGAIVVPREKLADAVIEALQRPPMVKFGLSLPDARTWAAKWRESLQ